MEIDPNRLKVHIYSMLYLLEGLINRFSLLSDETLNWLSSKDYAMVIACCHPP